MNHTLKNIIIGIVIIALLGLGYYLFFARSSDSPSPAPKNTGSLTTAEGAPVSSIINTEKPLGEVEATKIGQEFINQLLSLQAIKLDDEIFSSLSFQSLEDFTIVLIQPGNEGRPNPFAPFGSDGATSSSQGTPSFTVGEGAESGVVDPNAWLRVSFNRKDIFYPPTWTVATEFKPLVEEDDDLEAQMHRFTLLSMATITWGGLSSACSTSTYPAFQYGASTKICIRNTTVQIDGVDPTPETKTAFGDFVTRNK